MKLLKTEDAVGQVLCHDITQIIKGVTKDALFRKGHVIAEADIPLLLSLGKDHVYIWESDESTLHENEAAEILGALCKGRNIRSTSPKEGRINLVAEAEGLFTIRVDALDALNGLGEIVIASRHGGFAVKKGDILAGTRVIPLVIKKDKMEEAKRVAGSEPLMNVFPFKKKRIGVVTTGNEVSRGRIQDTFTPVIEAKFAEFGSEVSMHAVLDDDHEKITAKIREMLGAGMDVVVCTGGMSVDPDDRTPLAIRNSGARVVSYGAPLLPGSMFLLAYMDDGRPVMGLPGCVMYSKRTIFDLVLPSIMADVALTAERLAKYGEGGLCLGCDECRFPVCPFGK